MKNIIYTVRESKYKTIENPETGEFETIVEVFHRNYPAIVGGVRSLHVLDRRQTRKMDKLSNGNLWKDVQKHHMGESFYTEDGIFTGADFGLFAKMKHNNNNDMLAYCSLQPSERMFVETRDGMLPLVLDNVFVRTKFRHNGLAVQLLKNSLSKVDRDVYCNVQECGLAHLYKHFGFETIPESDGWMIRDKESLRTFKFTISTKYRTTTIPVEADTRENAQWIIEKIYGNIPDFEIVSIS